MKKKLPLLRSDLDPKPLSADVTMRFMMMVGEIIMLNKRNNGPYQNYRAIAESLHCAHTVFSQFGGTTNRNVTVEMLCWLHINHGANLNYLATGKGERYYNQEVAVKLQRMEEKTSAIEDRVSELEILTGKKSGKK